MTEDFVISTVSRADLESFGYDVANISDEEMRKLANKMGDDYCEQLYSSSLKFFADTLNFPKKQSKNS